MKNKAIFLDRDGTIIKDKGYLADTSQIEFIDGIPRTLKALKEKGYLLIVISNQSGVARGYFSEDLVKEINSGINEMLKRDYGFFIDAFYYCPHHPDYGNHLNKKDCDCRKPAPGLVIKAAGDFGIDIRRSVMIGDKPSDRIELPELDFIQIERDADWSGQIRKYLDETMVE